ncbi:(2Fe-2S)-binding protein [Burkholderia pseudomallei]|uniref:(2Fe-2S)-binding protein n=1 Tax=Burkholderia pseudomallei TaxID=28450 RepID=UPI0005E024A5|nr:(2Fe-2S)-binding protein [Burkholderia pseudomallei]CAJ3174353.1 2Fe-2S iron-sulfur cluster binding domain protein [Burkholderia pseudomallei]CAJ9802774.1 2Fe-2S iron-sulfur cluster binding domain protein [Burkholderia pseudomallei]CFL24238.1 NAD(FAD)-dependent dehydrogenase [Burkholderia pseudomallei]
MKGTPMFSPVDPIAATVTLIVNGQPVEVPSGISVAAALLMVHGSPPWRRSVVLHAPRAPFCLMGVCFECVACIDGRPGCRTCLTSVRAGMHITGEGSRDVV